MVVGIMEDDMAFFPVRTEGTLMQKNRTFVQLVPMLMLMLTAGCSLEEEAPRAIRGHTLVLDGISHGSKASHGERYCQGCHGAELQGGSSGEPSCFRCHGRRWEHGNRNQTSAPADHTEQMGGIWFHHPDMNSPTTACISCHGADLTGSVSNGTPSCVLCHEPKW